MREPLSFIACRSLVALDAETGDGYPWLRFICARELRRKAALSTTANLVASETVLRKAADHAPSPPPPLNPARHASTFEWCDCKTGMREIRVWPADNRSQELLIPRGAGAPVWMDWGRPTSKVSWLCDKMSDVQTTTFDTPMSYWSVQHSVKSKGFWPECGSDTGRLRFVGWQQADYRTSVPYTSGESGYYCVKIPVLLRTANRTLLAFAEARVESCSDFATTHLVVKRSEDGGVTWSELQIVRSELSTVIGNAAPVQLSRTSHQHSGRILLPHTRNNADVWLTYSDDDGRTWAAARALENATLPTWKWIGTGPPGAVQLQSGRILVPSYHGPMRGNLQNNKVHGHVILSDDGGDSWHIGSADGFDPVDDKFSNENQAVELLNGSVLINARSLADPGHVQQRVQALSDDGGETFGPARFVPELPQPLDGCQGSIASLKSRQSNLLLFSGPRSTILRTSMTLWTSEDEGATWNVLETIDSGASGYSSLQVVNGQDPGRSPEALLLYEQSDAQQFVMEPDRFVFRRIPLLSSSFTSAFQISSTDTVLASESAELQV